MCFFKLSLRYLPYEIRNVGKTHCVVIMTSNLTAKLFMFFEKYEDVSKTCFYVKIVHYKMKNYCTKLFTYHKKVMDEERNPLTPHHSTICSHRHTNTHTQIKPHTPTHTHSHSHTTNTAHVKRD